jgi:hypothetical protein
VLVLVGLASWFLWPKSVMREKYARIRIGMTRAEVTEIMGAEQSEAKSGRDLERCIDIVMEPSAGRFEHDHVGFWYDPSLESGVYIDVFYSHDKASAKMMWFRVPLWKVKAHEWLGWLCGLVGL